ncbi:FecR family protein [Solitalea canadensis]|uniref:Fe2+-dicitrate sensor, membrane component n=1 Tax=Solitalea canadensis (strain ATCC 29591 / DSM 3403 / JCM 21819 / LMG 8368 / NBRC 15130 / NCIMB 12057 / USAM 9D) TaxID=929556 RepID=H8KXK0_SOLCM|nr:FecR domain-containing protein [Solitalea canadensis]AFD05296.1 Fe2+-dicitrate sensor, membrane component [Solitalea canadensis DSM 3403]
MSIIDKHIFFEILRKYQQGQASAEEIRFLHAYYHSFEVYPDFLVPENEHLHAKLEREIKNAVDNQLNQYQNGIKRRKLQKLAFKYAAAAILILSVGSYFIISKKQGTKKTEQELSLATRIVPGGNNAILTLADGSTVVLNDIKNGVVANENNAVITKNGDDQIVYTLNKNSSSVKVSQNVLATPKGGTYHVVLPDGTKVWLNAASSLTYPTEFIGKERIVKVNGEAYFEVAHNETKPFKVIAANQEVAVLGTHFNVNSYASEAAVKTTLLQGSVRVSLIENERTKQTSVVILKPGQQSLSNQYLVVQQADIKQVMGWKNGDFIFKRAPLDEIMRELERWYDIEVEFTTDIRIDRTYSGLLSRSKNLATVLKMLKSTGQIKFEIEGKKIKVTEIN